MYRAVEIALAEVGYLEKASNYDLDSKTGNAGYNNYTKYARDLDALGNFYNGKKQGYAWCDVFVDWCFVQAYGVEEAKKMLYQPDYSLGAGCYYSVRYYKDAGAFYTTPKVGDQIFFTDSEGDPGHTGLVWKLDNDTVYTVEGNTSGSSGVIENGGGVHCKQYSRSYSRIHGYGRPNYEEEIKMQEEIDALKKAVEALQKEIAALKAHDTQEAWDKCMDIYRTSLETNDADEYSKEAREWSVRNGIVKGIQAPGEPFNGAWRDLVTREQLVTMLYREKALLL